MKERRSKVNPYGYVKNLHMIEAAFFDVRFQNRTRNVLFLMIRYANQDGFVKIFSVTKIARILGCSRRAIQNQITKIIQHGYVQRIENLGRPCSYILRLEKLNYMGDVIQLNHTPTEPVTLCGHTHATQLSDTPATSLSHTKKEKEKIRREARRSESGAVPGYRQAWHDDAEISFGKTLVDNWLSKVFLNEENRLLVLKEFHAALHQCPLSERNSEYVSW